MEKGTDFPSEQNKPSFFKVMIGSYDTELRIPVLFVKKFPHFLPQKVVLRVSPSKLWIVDVVKENKKDWYFKTGWNKFVKDNALEVGEFLVFQFAGSSTFNVKIFGISACDKEVQMGSVPCYSDVTAATKNRKERIPTADSGKGNHKERIPTADAGKANPKERTPTAEARNENPEERILAADAGKENQKETIPTADAGKENLKERIPTVDAGKQYQKERIPTADDGKVNPKERKSTTPVNQQKRKMEDVIQLKREEVDSNEDIKLEKVDSNEDIKLSDALNDVRFTERDEKEGEEENDDEVIEIKSDSDRDIGYYGRLIQKKRRICSDAVEKDGLFNSKTTSSNAVKNVGSLNTNNPSFQIVMKQAYAGKGILNLPTVFVKKHLNNMKEKIEIELETCKGTWAVKMIRHPKGIWTYGRFSAGWLDFARDNDLRAGDTCNFELVRKDSPLFFVHVLRK